MREARFRVGEAVMVRCEQQPQLNCDFAIIVERKNKVTINATTGDLNSGWKYKTDRAMLGWFEWWSEKTLRPIPPEKGTGIDATDYIKSLRGITA